jgi:hypothetical protein
MIFSTFCWHNEDHYTYSINYQHWGETKTWYGVPGEDADKLENAMRKAAPDLFETLPDLLFHLTTMMSPEKLKKEGVRVYACDQRANEFVVTFPKAYHSGFNHGINLNEAVNFALPDWIFDDLESVRRYQHFGKPAVFSHDQLLITVSQQSQSIETSVWLEAPMQEMVDREIAKRNALREIIPDLKEEVYDEDVPESHKPQGRRRRMPRPRFRGVQCRRSGQVDSEAAILRRPTALDPRQSVRARCHSSQLDPAAQEDPVSRPEPAAEDTQNAAARGREDCLLPRASRGPQGLRDVRQLMDGSS